MTRKTNHPLGQSMATAQKALHVDGRVVALGLNPHMRAVVHQVRSESSYSYSRTYRRQSRLTCTKCCWVANGES